MRLRRIAAAASLLALVAAGAAAVSLGSIPAPQPGRSALLSTLVLDRDGRLLRPFAAADGAWRLPVERSGVDPRFLRMLLAYEDKRFFAHPGVDPLAALRAAWQAARSGGIVSGGSTLTMQVVRLLTPDRSRTLPRKWREAGAALALEREAGKTGVLDLYLRLAPYGGNLEGVRAASLAFFGKEPARLSIAEAALLVAAAQSDVSNPELRAVSLTSLYRAFALPFTVAGSVLLAFALGGTYRRRGDYGNAVLLGLIVGFVLFVVSEMATRAGNAQVISPLAATTGPALLSLLAGATALLFREDGKL